MLLFTMRMEVFGDAQTFMVTLNQRKKKKNILGRFYEGQQVCHFCHGSVSILTKSLNETMGGNEKNSSRVHEFRQVVRDCGLTDLGLNGYPFTQSNRRFGPHLIEKRLDRFFCNQNWCSLYQKTAAQNIISWSSYHSLILMEIIGKDEGQRYKRRTFQRVHYEEMWSAYEKCKEIVQQEWQEKSKWNKENPIELFKKRAKVSLGELQLQSKKEFGGRQKQLKQLENKLKTIRHDFSHYDCGDELKKT